MSVNDLPNRRQTLSPEAADRIRTRAAALAAEWQATADAATDPEQKSAAQAIADSHARRATSTQAGMRIGRA